MGIRRNRSLKKRASFGTALWVAALCMNCACASPGRGNPIEPTPAPAPQKLASLEQPDHLFAAPTRADRIGRIMAPVTINGRGPFRLIVDTGANQSVLTSSLVQALGIELTPDNTVRLTGVTGSQIVPMIKLDSLQTGDLEQRDLKVAVMRTVSGGAEGILGMQGFAGKRITVDFVNDRIQIAASRGQRAGFRYASIPVEVRFNRLLLATGRVGGVKVQAVIDTGAERTLGNSALRRELVRLKKLPEPPSIAGVIGLTEVEQRGEAIWTRKIQLGDISLTDVNVIYGDMHVFKVWELENQPAILIGMDVLGLLHTLVVDYRLKELQVRVRS
ncbi:MAG: retroviral-like aspartic protease family protein [Povalibacter sp.]